MFERDVPISHFSYFFLEAVGRSNGILWFPAFFVRVRDERLARENRRSAASQKNSFPVNPGTSTCGDRLSLPLTGGRRNGYNDNGEKGSGGRKMERAYQILKEYFGYKEFRDGQKNMIQALLAGQDALGIMPTGAGKSLCFQIPALLFPGITLVVSPPDFSDERSSPGVAPIGGCGGLFEPLSNGTAVSQSLAKCPCRQV